MKKLRYQSVVNYRGHDVVVSSSYTMKDAIQGLCWHCVDFPEDMDECFFSISTEKEKSSYITAAKLFQIAEELKIEDI